MRLKNKLFSCVLTSVIFVANFALADGAGKSVPVGKLPNVIAPISYKLDFTIIPEKSNFTGHSEIIANLKTPSKSIFMHANGIVFSNAQAMIGNKKYAAIVREVDKTGVISLDFTSALPKGKVKLVFDYEAPFTEDAAGLHHVKVGEDFYAWTQFESIDARAAFPSFDEPGYKTPFEVSIATKKEFTAVSNAPEIKTSDEGDLTRHYFAPTKPLPTYLVAMVVGPFITKASVVPPTPQRKEPLPIRVVATKPNADKLDYVLQETPRIVSLLEEYFNAPFPYPKLDQIGSPIMPGAMENAGADIYNDSIILLDKNAPTSQKQSFGMIVSHELSHQWFGDYVTPKWWDDIWLNESFANWMGFKIGNDWRPELNIGVGAIDEAFSAMQTDALKVGRPIHEKITHNKDIDQAFDSITYGKGGQVVSMIANYLGDNTFREGVRLHMKRHPHGNASTEEFFGALGDAAKDPRIVKSLKSFVDQKGFPVIDIKRQGDNYIASQYRYSNYGTKLPSQTWSVPLCIRQEVKKSCTLIESKPVKLNLEVNKAFIPNAGGLGYYRFNLEDADWHNLIKSANSLSAGEALALTDSLWGSYRAGIGNVDNLIMAAKVLSTNSNSNVATDGIERLQGLNRRGYFENSGKTEYQKLMRSMIMPKLSEMGTNVAQGAYASDDPDKQKLRAQLISIAAFDGNDETLRTALKDAANQYLAGNITAIDNSLARTAFAVLGEEGNLETTKLLFEKLKATAKTVERTYFLAGIGNGNVESAKFIFDNFKDEKLRASDKIGLLGSYMGNEKTRDFAYEWFKANYNSLGKSIGIFSAGSLSNMPASFCSVAKAKEADVLLRQKVIEAGRGELSFNRMLEGVTNCGLLKEKRQDEVIKAIIKAGN